MVGSDGHDDGVSDDGEQMSDDAEVHAMRYPPRPLWQRLLAQVAFTGLIAAGGFMVYDAIDRVFEEPRLEQRVVDAQMHGVDLEMGLAMLRSEAGVDREEDGTLVSRFPVSPSDAAILAEFCEHQQTIYPDRDSYHAIYESIVEIDLIKRNYSTGSATGVMITENGYILAAHHVVGDMLSGVVRTRGGSEYRIEMPVLISSPNLDLAIIKADIEGEAQLLPYNRGFQIPAVKSEVHLFGILDGIPFNQFGRVQEVQHGLAYSNLNAQDVVLTSSIIRRGFSGGAAVRGSDGTLIGIATYGEFDDGEDLGCPSGFVPLVNVRDLISHYLAYQTPE